MTYDINSKKKKSEKESAKIYIQNEMTYAINLKKEKIRHWQHKKK